MSDVDEDFSFGNLFGDDDEDKDDADDESAGDLFGDDGDDE